MSRDHERSTRGGQAAPTASIGPSDATALPRSARHPPFHATAPGIAAFGGDF
ncbi:hypothetical protein ACFFQW_24770 [Umezawaea endophytica]|uniref:hypothetical protein n=1 Tax=Umezawaea endophytica TaxID=1654476 RepID=UPI0035E9D894